MVEFVTGDIHEYEAQIDFGLNFDDRNIKSVKVKKGKLVKYDGESASYVNDTGDLFSGRCSSLKSAINIMSWLLPYESPEPLLENPKCGAEATEKVTGYVSAPNDYHNLKGGSFDTAVVKTGEFAFMGQKPKREIIREDDQVVKRIPALKRASSERPIVKKRLEIALDQNAVKKVGEKLSVNSTTVKFKEKKRKLDIVQADEMNADLTFPLKGVLPTKTPKGEKKSFIVDNTTPRTVSSDMTLKEVHRVMKVESAEDSQNAQIVKKIDRSKIRVKEVEGITMNRPKPQGQDIVMNKVKAPLDMTINTQVGKPGTGSSEVFDTVNEATVVATIGQADQVKKVDAEVKELAMKRAANRKKASLVTQEKIEEKYGLRTAKTKLPVKKVVKKKVVKKKVVKKKVVKKKTDSKVSSKKYNYLLMLPENWGGLHWTKKEKFIRELTDVEFIKYILTAESTKAIKNACQERLVELGEKNSG